MEPIDPHLDADDPAPARPRRRGSTSRQAVATRAYVVVPVLTGRKPGPRPTAEEVAAERTLDGRLEEAVGLAAAIDLEIAGRQIVRIADPRPSTLMGSGKVEEIKAFVEAEKVGLVIVDHALTPIQQRNLEKDIGTKVLDRTGLILEIFGARARTKEGRLQVEHAHLTYQKSRLVRSWTHLERQRGGFGFLGGPGETQIEADRRIIQERLDKLERDLDRVKQTRELHRKTRKKVPHPVVALVGYTNAGKSTLFNRLTEAEVFAKDLLFATLDPTLRRVRLPHGGEIILSDTVGFISDLPTHLVAAFRATLEEVIEADLILHVRDIAHPDTVAQSNDVHDVMRQLGVDFANAERMVEVLNKVDLLDPTTREAVLERAQGDGPATVGVSALTGEGIPALLQLIEDKLNRDRGRYQIALPAADGALVAWAYRSLEVLGRRDEDTEVVLTVRVPDKALDHFRAKAGGYIIEPAV